MDKRNGLCFHLKKHQSYIQQEYLMKSPVYLVKLILIIQTLADSLHLQVLDYQY